MHWEPAPRYCYDLPNHASPIIHELTEDVDDLLTSVSTDVFRFQLLWPITKLQAHRARTVHFLLLYSSMCRVVLCCKYARVSGNFQQKVQFHVSCIYWAASYPCWDAIQYTGLSRSVSSKYITYKC